MKATALLALMTMAADASAMVTTISEAKWVLDAAKSSRGRWIVVVPTEDGPIGYRIQQLSRARTIARELGGKVRRYHKKNWRQRQPDFVSTELKGTLDGAADLFPLL